MTTFDPQPLILDGTRARLEPLGPAHREPLAAAAADAAIWHHLSADLSTSPAFAPWWEGALAANAGGREVVFVIRDKRSGELAGSTRYMAIERRHRRLEIGWTWLAPQHWGGPLNTECKLLLLVHAFERLGAHRVEFRTDVLNRRSQAAIEALGATREGIFRRHMVMRKGRVRDSVQYAIVDTDWPTLRPRLERRLACRLEPAAGRPGRGR